MNLQNFIEKNKDKIRKIAKSNTKINSEGLPTISRNDPWFYEDEWDEHFKELQSKLDIITKNADVLETDENGRIELDPDNEQHREWFEED
jgi:hypothetical protein